MRTIYRIRPEADRYQSLAFVDDEFASSHRFDGDKYQEDWSPPAVRILNPSLKVPDFWSIAGKAVFALTWDLSMELPVLDSFGEMLPLSFDDRNLHVLNVTNVYNCLDKKMTVFSRTDPSKIDRYAFISRRLSDTVFKLLETGEHELLAVEGMVGPEDEFKSTVEVRGLKGLAFEKIWSEAE